MSEPQRPAIPALMLASAAVSVLMAVLFFFTPPWGLATVAGLGLSGVVLFLAVSSTVAPRPGLPVALLGALSLQFGVFALTLAGLGPLGSRRLLQLIVVLGYGAIMLAALLSRTGVLAPARAGALALALALGLFSVEVTLGVMTPPDTDPSGRSWTSGMTAEPLLGRAYPPQSTLVTTYPDNPRGYFESEDLRPIIWGLNAMRGAAATLVLPPGDHQRVRVTIEKATPESTWKIQLEKAHLSVDSGIMYTVNFRARADQPRKADVTFGQAHEPWLGLGSYRTLELTPEWQSFQVNARTPFADTNARIQFNLAASDIPVEISGATLRGPPDGRAVEPTLPPQRHSVRYAFNATGCRDRDYPAERPPRTLRILALGDAATMGIGVHEGDTFAKRLERAAAADARQRYEVINCGISGYSTREERLFYQRLGQAYRPDIVLLVMGLNDDVFAWEEELQRAAGPGPGRLERLFLSWGRLKNRDDRPRTHDYARCIPEILELERAVRADGARLVVAMFRHNADPRWASLSGALAAGLAGSPIPIVDLGESLLGERPDSDFQVHDSDPRPNEIAHQAAAQALLRFLQAQKPGPATKSSGTR